MKKTMLGKTNLEIPVIAVGCMRIAEMETNRLTEHIRFCIEHGLNFFDHADIYGGGQCESRFAEVDDFLEQMVAAQALPHTDYKKYPTVMEKLKKRQNICFY